MSMSFVRVGSYDKLSDDAIVRIHSGSHPNGVGINLIPASGPTLYRTLLSYPGTDHNDGNGSVTHYTSYMEATRAADELIRNIMQESGASWAPVYQ